MVKQLCQANKLFTEKFCLQTATAACVIIAIYSVTAGILSHSTALILDGTLSVIDVLTCFITLYILKLINFPPSDRFPFGYYKLEPLAIALQAAMIIITCLISVLHSIKDAIHHTSSITHYGWGFSYTIFTTALVFAMCFYIKAVIKRKSTNLLLLELLDWEYGLKLTIGLLLGFTLSYYFVHSSAPLLRYLAQYVDAAMTILIVILIIHEPTVMCIQSCHELLDMKAHLKMTNSQLVSAVENCAKKFGLTIFDESFTLRKAGRVYFGTLRYEVATTTTIEQIIQFNSLLTKNFKEEFSNVFMEFIPTMK